MSVPLLRWTLPTAALLLAACNADQPLTAPNLAKGPAGQQFGVAPGAVAFTFPPGGSEVVTVTAQYLTTVTSSSSNTGCATVSPTSVPTKKPKGSSSYVATFTISATGVGNCSITLADKNGKQVTVQVSVAAPLPDRIVYAAEAVNGTTDVWIMDLDGQNKTRLTNTDDLSELGTLSPDGRQIIFLWTGEVGGALSFGYKVMNVDGSGQTPISVSGVIRRPAYSPNSRQLVFARESGLQHHLYKADLSGANEVPLTPGNPITAHFASHWGGGIPGRIVFIRGGIWIMNEDGTGQVEVVAVQAGWLAGPTTAALSPDGTRIVFACHPSINELDICVVNVDGTGKTRLTDAAAADLWPRWTRDGRIVFTSLRDGNEEVYIMNADGTGQTSLTNSQGSERTERP